MIFTFKFSCQKNWFIQTAYSLIFLLNSFYISEILKGKTTMAINIAYKHRREQDRFSSNLSDSSEDPDFDKSMSKNLNDFKEMSDEEENCDENVSDDDSDDGSRPYNSKQGVQSMKGISSIGDNALNRRESPWYSFSKNIDYSKITERQKRRHLKEKRFTTHHRQQFIVPSSSSKKNCYKENIIPLGHQTQQLMNSSKGNTSVGSFHAVEKHVPYYAQLKSPQEATVSQLMNGTPEFKKESSQTSQGLLQEIDQNVQNRVVQKRIEMVDNKKMFAKPRKSAKPTILQSTSYSADSHRNMFGGAKAFKPTPKATGRAKIQVHRLSIDTSTQILPKAVDFLPKKVHTTKNAIRVQKDKENRSKSRTKSKSPSAGASALGGGKSQTYLRSEYNPRGKVVVKKGLKAPLTRKVPHAQEERKVLSGGSRRQGQKAMGKKGVSPKSMGRYLPYEREQETSQVDQLKCKNAQDDLASDDDEQQFLATTLPGRPVVQIQLVENESQVGYEVSQKPKQLSIDLRDNADSDTCSQDQLTYDQECSPRRSSVATKNGQLREKIWRPSYEGAIVQTPKVRRVSGNKDQENPFELFGRGEGQLDLREQLKSLPHSRLSRRIAEEQIGSKVLEPVVGGNATMLLVDSRDNTVDDICHAMLGVQSQESVEDLDPYSARGNPGQNMGPQRASKQNRMSNDRNPYMNEGPTTRNARMTAQTHKTQSGSYTSHSLTCPDDDNMDEFTVRASLLSDQSNQEVSPDARQREDLKVLVQMGKSNVPASMTVSASEITQFKGGDTTGEDVGRPSIMSAVSIGQISDNQKHLTLDGAQNAQVLQYTGPPDRGDRKSVSGTIEDCLSMRSPEFGVVSASQTKQVQGSSQCPCECQGPCKREHISPSDFQGKETQSLHQSQRSQSQSQPEEAAEPDLDQEINYEVLHRQQQILSSLRDLLEIRPSVVQNFQSSQKAGETEMSQHAIEGLGSEQRVKVQQLCQEWWDITQEDDSIYRAALSYQRYTEQTYQEASMQDQSVTEREIEEKATSIRQCVVLSSVVVGMTAFFSMLQRSKPKVSSVSLLSSESSALKQDLELRSRLSQLLKIVYDQMILGLSYTLGKLGGYEQTIANRQTMESKLHTAYLEHIHLLYINKKIQCEDDYLIFNTKGIVSQLETTAYIANEENRDYQLNQLSKRLKDNINRIVDNEIELQSKQLRAGQRSGNLELLCVLKDIALHSIQVDFQEGKNLIYEGITGSEVMPGAGESANQGDSQATDKQGNSLEEIQVDLEDQGEIDPFSSGQRFPLIKNFNQDQEYVIPEESREESAEITQMSMRQQDLDTSASVSQIGQQLRRMESSYIENQNNITASAIIENQIQLEHSVIKLKRGGANTSSSGTPASGSRASRATTKGGNNALLILTQDNGPLEDDSLLLNCYEHLNTTTHHYLPQNPVSVPYLPVQKSNKQYTLVLDLDETLIYCPHHGDQEGTMISFYRRPYLRDFLKSVSSWFEIVIFTAGGQEYADAILDSLSDCKQYIDHRLYWDHVSVMPQVETDMSEGGPQAPQNQEKSASQQYYKDLSKMGRDLSKVLIVDNIEDNFQAQKDNGIQIRDWRGDDPQDRALQELSELLQNMVEQTQYQLTDVDLRPVLKRHLKVYKQKIRNLRSSQEAAFKI